MENNPGTGFHHHHLDLQSSEENMLSSPLNMRLPNTLPGSMKVCSNDFPMGELPGSFGVPHFRGNQTNNPPHGWFYCLPRYHQNFNLVPNSTLKKEVPISASARLEEAMSPNPKRFIVFDQSGGQTTVVYSSGIRTPIPCLTSLVPKVGIGNDVNKIELETRRDTVQYSGPIKSKNEGDDKRTEDLGTEIHEDTDEINAFLYPSDEDENSENEEEASTGHSPCVITENDKQDLFEEIGEEVASSFRPAKRTEDLGTEIHEDTDEINALLYSSDEDENSENEEEASTSHSPCVITENDEQDLFEGIREVASSFRPAKRMKFTDGGYDVPSLHDTANSDNFQKCFGYEDDAESGCGSEKNEKSLRKDKIREAVSILQKILPAGNGKDVVTILDEAIGYLKSLKHKALDLGVEIL